MPKKVSVDSCFEKFSDTYSPKIVGDLNGQQVKLVRLEGDKVPWHMHDEQDELFWVLDGELDVLDHEGSVTLRTSEFCIVPRGVEHRVVPRGYVRLMLFEPEGTEHTGKVRAEITLDEYDRLDT